MLVFVVKQVKSDETLFLAYQLFSRKTAAAIATTPIARLSTGDAVVTATFMPTKGSRVAPPKITHMPAMKLRNSIFPSLFFFWSLCFKNSYCELQFRRCAHEDEYQGRAMHDSRSVHASG